MACAPHGNVYFFLSSTKPLQFEMQKKMVSLVFYFVIVRLHSEFTQAYWSCVNVRSLEALVKRFQWKFDVIFIHLFIIRNYPYTNDYTVIVNLIQHRELPITITRIKIQYESTHYLRITENGINRFLFCSDVVLNYWLWRSRKVVVVVIAIDISLYTYLWMPLIELGNKYWWQLPFIVITF